MIHEDTSSRQHPINESKHIYNHVMCQLHAYNYI